MKNIILLVIVDQATTAINNLLPAKNQLDIEKNLLAIINQRDKVKVSKIF